ncbi:MAG: hypothetical protein WCB92_07685, partial [Mycobacterium sp.]
MSRWTRVQKRGLLGAALQAAGTALGLAWTLVLVLALSTGTALADPDDVPGAPGVPGAVNAPADPPAQAPFG